MKPLYIAGVAVLGLITLGGIVAYRKAARIAAIFDLMDIKPIYASKFSIDGGNLVFKVDVEITNKSEDDLFVSGLGVAKLKKIVFFYEGVQIAEADPNVTAISIESGDTLTLKNIPVRAKIGTLLLNAASLLRLDLNKMTCIGIVDAFGSEYQIG